MLRGKVKNVLLKYIIGAPPPKGSVLEASSSAKGAAANGALPKDINSPSANTYTKKRV